MKILGREVNFFNLLYLLYEGVYKRGEVIVSREHTGFIWVDPISVKLEQYLK